MKRRFTIRLVAVLAVSFGSFQGSSFARPPADGNSQSSPSAGEEQGFLAVELAKPLDSKNLKPGAEVEAIVDSPKNGMSIPRGSKVVGHVIDAKALEGRPGI
jgi:hypothetical protein